MKKGFSYLMRFRHFAFGGGLFMVSVEHVAGSRICIDGRWHDVDVYLESREIVEELGEYESDKDGKITLKNKE